MATVTDRPDGRLAERSVPVTVSDLRCDVCGRLLAGPGGGCDPRWPAADGAATGAAANQPTQPAPVRFVYDPGVPELRDDSGLACEPCWDRLVAGFAGPGGPPRCARCGTAVGRRDSLRVRRFDDPRPWRLCGPHTVELLNALRTVQPKLDPAAFRFPAPKDT